MFGEKTTGRLSLTLLVGTVLGFNSESALRGNVKRVKPRNKQVRQIAYLATFVSMVRKTARSTHNAYLERFLRVGTGVVDLHLRNKVRKIRIR